MLSRSLVSITLHLKTSKSGFNINNNKSSVPNSQGIQYVSKIMAYKVMLFTCSYKKESMFKVNSVGSAVTNVLERLCRNNEIC